MATATAAPITRFLRLSRDAASVRKSSSPLAGIVPARMKPHREPVEYEKVRKGVEKSGGKTVYRWDTYRRENKMAEGQKSNHRMKGGKQ